MLLVQYDVLTLPTTVSIKNKTKKWSDPLYNLTFFFWKKSVQYIKTKTAVGMMPKKPEVEKKNRHSNHEIPFRKMELSKLNKDTTTTKIKKY